MLDITSTDHNVVNSRPRESNMELLRLAAMVLVMVVHANFRALPVPGPVQIAASPVSAALQFLTEGLSIIAVDVFVLLSGWFGIRPRVTRLCELLFQVLFFTVCGVVIAEVISPGSALGSTDFWPRFFMLGDGQYWFVKTYIGLYLFAPVLNAYVERATRRQFTVLLVSLLAFQCLCGWWWDAVTWFRSGYSLPSFMILYLLARYMRLHPLPCWRMSRAVDMAIYLAMALALTALMYIIKHDGGQGAYLYYYSCPLVIVGAMHLLLFFSKIHFSSRLVNVLGRSALAIYLTHSGTFLWTFYDGAIRDWFATASRARFVLYVAALMVVVFVSSILLDRVRLLLWRALEGIATRQSRNPI